MSYVCSDCGFTGEGWHKWFCKKGVICPANPNATPVLDHFDNLGPPKDPQPEMLPVIKED